MVALAAILTAEVKDKNPCGHCCGEERIPARAARRHACSPVHLLPSPVCRQPTRDPIGYEGGMNLYEYSAVRSAQAADPHGTGPAFVVFSTQIYWCIGDLFGYCHGTCTCGVKAPYAPSRPVTEAAVTGAMFVSKEACCVESFDACGLRGAGQLQPKAMTLCLTKAMNLVYLSSAVSCNCS